MTRNSQSITVHQFHPWVSSGDAITNQMFLIQKTLKEQGMGGNLFALEPTRISHSVIKKFSPEEMGRGELLLVHHSSGNPILRKILRLKIPKALIYHNITPEIFFRHDRYISNLTKLGRNQLRLFRRRVSATFADSRFNAKELESLGFRNTEIMPLLDLSKRSLPEKKKHQIKRMKKLLFVGRIAPHKNQALLIKILYCLNHLSPDKYHLVLVGGGDPFYLDYLKLLSRALEVDVLLAGKVHQSTLEAHYRSADAFVSVSLHEGYCIPLIEAMQAGLPVFALTSAAVPETLGGAGVEINTKNPCQIALIIDTVLRDSEKKATQRANYVKFILQSQSKRLKQLREIQTSKRIGELCLKLIHTVQK